MCRWSFSSTSAEISTARVKVYPDSAHGFLFQHHAEWVEITGQPAKQVIAGVTEIVSETQMEYGLILPRPGDETEWFAKNADALDGISGTGL